MKVLIVGKTRMLNARCIGALDLSNYRSLRLLEANGYYPSVDTPFDVGDVWQINYAPAPGLRPPQLEGVLVRQAEYEKACRIAPDWLLRHVAAWRGGPNKLFDGLLQCTNAGRGYISERSGIPNCSTGYWIPDRPLHLVQEGGKRVYRYERRGAFEFGVRDLAYVGIAEPDEIIPAGGLVRVSLAGWWKPEDSDPDFEERCYLQLSGWFPA